MRIAYLTQSYPPMISGAAISAQQTAEAMAQRGHIVLVVAASDRAYPYQTYKYNLAVLRLRSFNNPLRVDQRLTTTPRRATLKALRKFQPDLIHVHEPIQMGMLALEYAKTTRIPVMITAHQLPWFVASYLPKALKPLIERVLWPFARAILDRYSGIIAPTTTIAKIVEQMTGIKPSVISYGIDLQNFHPPLLSDDGTAIRQKLDLPLGMPLILHVGRLDTDKRADMVIRASAPVMRKTNAHLLMVGDGCQKNNLIQLCDELGIEDRVHFVGYISQHDGLPEIYRDCNVFITASEIETQGLVLLEAVASGLPIVAVNATCIPEIVHEQVNGFLVNPGDLTAMSNRTITLLNNPQLACTMGRAGRLLAKEHDIQRTWSLHEKLYMGLVRKSHIPHAQPVFEKVKLNPWKTVKTRIGLK